MNAPHHPDWSVLSTDRRDRLTAALPLLLAAAEDGRGAGRAAWQFAVTAAELLDAGLRVIDLRWLVDRRLIDHAQEQSRSGGRRFRPDAGLAVSGRSCFLPTAAGLRFWDARPGQSAVPPGPGGSGQPHWDGRVRELTWRGLLVKRFRTPARCQELILAAFQEEEWPPRIDDPLGPGGGRQPPEERLHEAVRGLNRSQLAARVRFARDGTGQGVRWAA